MRLVAVGLAAAVGLVAVVAFDAGATRRELLSLLSEEASSLRDTVAAAARSNREAGRLIQAQLVARLLDDARLLGALDRRGLLDEAELDTVVRRHGLFRASVFAPDGRLDMGSAAEGRPRQPRGRGAGRSLLRELLAEGRAEATTELHVSRWGEGPRLAAGVRRAGGGAIVLNADASAVAELGRQASLDALLADVAASTRDLAWLVLESGEGRIVHGDLTPSGSPGVLEVSGPVRLGSGEATLRLGMRLDRVERAERRRLVQLVLSLAAALALAAVGFATLGLERRYGRLSERHRRAEEALRRRDRLTAMGELASTVAHEVRNPLNAIAMSARRLRREFLPRVPEGEDRPDLEELLGILEGETSRINGIVQQFLDFARPPRLALRATDLDALLETVAEESRALADTRGVRLEVDSSRAGEARVDPDQLRQALQNLVRNGVEATPEGGAVTLAARRTDDGVELAVRDSGPGIPAEDLPRIFDLYFTTKPRGTGVGLAVTQQIATAHGGSIEVDSLPGAGTRMILRLPRDGGGASRG